MRISKSRRERFRKKRLMTFHRREKLNISKKSPGGTRGRVSVWEVVAVIVSACAAAIALWQSFLLQEQLIAGDRNRSIENVVNKGESLCEAFLNIPAPTFSREFDLDSKWVLKDSLESVSVEAWRTYSSEIKRSSTEFSSAYKILKIYMADERILRLSRVENSLTDNFLPSRVGEDWSERMENLADVYNLCREWIDKIYWISTGERVRSAGYQLTLEVLDEPPL